jgi:hypothetical protein
MVWCLDLLELGRTAWIGYMSAGFSLHSTPRTPRYSNLTKARYSVLGLAVVFFIAGRSGVAAGVRQNSETSQAGVDYSNKQKTSVPLMPALFEQSISIYIPPDVRVHIQLSPQGITYHRFLLLPALALTPQCVRRSSSSPLRPARP